jgi:hypothetical protein
VEGTGKSRMIFTWKMFLVLEVIFSFENIFSPSKLALSFQIVSLNFVPLKKSRHKILGHFFEKSESYQLEGSLASISKL